LRTYLTCAEIAELALPGLPVTVSGVWRTARRNAWIGREREGRGGGLEYSIDVLPPDARAAYVARHVELVELPASLAAEAEAEPEAQELTASAGSARDARLAVLAAAARLAETAGLGRKRADRHFCDLYNAGTIEVAAWIKVAVKTVTPRSLMRWRAAAKAGKTHRLAVDRGAARRGTGVLDRAGDGEVKTYCLALIAKQPHLTADHVRAIVADRFGGSLTVGTKMVPVPPVRTFQQALKGWRERHRVELLALSNPDLFRSKMRIAGSYAHLITRLNEQWQIDASKIDVLDKDGRHNIYVCIDVYSRRMIILLSETPRAAAVGLLIRKAILTWGVPERIKSDNGSDFIAHASRRLLAALGIEHEVAPPYSPWKKGVVERAIRTVQHDLMPAVPGYIGHSVADRKLIEERKSFAARLGDSPEKIFCIDLTLSELQDYCDHWIAQRYETRPHAGLSGASPFQVAAAWREPVRRIDDVAALDMLLAPLAGKDGLRTVSKSGIRINKSQYSVCGIDPGTVVLVRMDPADLGRAYLFDESGETFLGHAISPELTGIDPVALHAASLADQKQRVSEATADVKAQMRKFKPRDFVDAVLRQSARESGTLVAFPPPAPSTHATPQLAAATSAGTTWEPTHSAETLEIQAKLLSEDARAGGERVVPLRKPETDWDRFTRARSIEQSLARGDAIDPEARRWLAGYQKGPEYRGFKTVFGDAGAAGGAA
jgi:transposase InsO family protein